MIAARTGRLCATVAPMTGFYKCIAKPDCWKNKLLILKTLALIVILAISGLHFAWAAKLWWPISDEKQLVRTVAGFANAENMPPPASCFTVAIALCGLALLLVAEIVQERAGASHFSRASRRRSRFLWSRCNWFHAHMGAHHAGTTFSKFGPEILLSIVLGSRFHNCDDCSVLARGE